MGLPLAAAAAAAAPLVAVAALRARVTRPRAQACRGEGGPHRSGFASPAALAGCRSSPRRRPPCAGCPCGMPVGSAPSPPLRRPPLRVAGRLRAVDPFARVDAAAGLGRRPLRSLAAVAPRANHAVTSARRRLIGVAYAVRPPLRDAGQDLRRQPPRRDAGRLRFVDLSLRGSTRPGPRLSLAARAHIDAVTSVRHRLCMSLCCCARLPSTDVGPSGLRARRGMASPGAVAFALRAARSRRSASFPCWDCAPVSSRGTTAAQAGLTARVILLSGQVRFRVIAGAPFGAPHGVAARPCDRASARNGLLRCSSSLLLSSSVTVAIEACSLGASMPSRGA